MAAADAAAALSMSAEERSSLHACIAEYLASMKFEASVEAFCREASIAAPPLASSSGGPVALERKWRSVVRLQRRVIELEDASQKKKDSVVQTARGSWSVRTPSASTLRGHRASVTALAAHASSGLLASGSEDGTTKVWDLDRRSLLRTLTAHVDAVNWVCFDDDSLLTCSSDHTAKVYRDNFQVVRATLTHQDSVLCGVFMNETIATSSRDGEVKTWTLDGACLSTTIQPHEGWTRALAAVSYEDEDGDEAWLLAAAGSKEDATILVPGFSFQDSENVVLKGHSHQLEALAWRSTIETKDLATASRDNTIRLWRIRTPSLAHSCVAELAGHASWVKSVCWCGDRLLSAGDDRTIKVWTGFSSSSSSSATPADGENNRDDSDDGGGISTVVRCLKTVDAAHPAFISSLAVNVPSALLASAGADKVIKLWEMA